MPARDTGMSHPDLVRFADALVKELHQRGLMRSCPDCQWWDPKAETCGKYLARPPADVIAKGCDEFEPTIPF